MEPLRAVQLVGGKKIETNGAFVGQVEIARQTCNSPSSKRVSHGPASQAHDTDLRLPIAGDVTEAIYRRGGGVCHGTLSVAGIETNSANRCPSPSDTAPVELSGFDNCDR